MIYTKKVMAGGPGLVLESRSMNDQVADLEKQIFELRQKLTEARRHASPEVISTKYTFQTADGAATLAELFKDKADLIVIHNMGKSCPYCTLWADGFNGEQGHLRNRAAFVLVSPDEVATQQAFAQSRGWSYPVASAAGATFTKDMGFEHNGSPMPGVSAFHKSADGSITRTGKANFGPGDEFCAVWHLFDLLKDGADGWSPKYEYV